MEAEACVIKYFTAASVDRGDFLIVIKGIIANKFISNPTQERNQWELSKTVIVPRKIIRIIDEKMIGLISMGRVITNIFGVWAR